MVVNLKQHTMPITGLKLFPDDSAVYSASRDRTILQWDLRSETRKSSMTQRMGGINAIDMLPDTTSLVSVGQEKLVSMWDNRESSPLVTTGAPPGAPPISRQSIHSTASRWYGRSVGRSAGTGGIGSAGRGGRASTKARSRS